MDSATAYRLCQENGTFLCLDVPVGTDFGINQHTWTTAASFSGVKMVPPGFHFIHWKNSISRPFCNNVKGSNQEEADITGKGVDRVGVIDENTKIVSVPASGILPLLGSFVFFQKKHIIVKKWDPVIEDMKDVEPEETERYAEGVRNMDFDQNLGPFPFGEQYERWIQLTNFISKETVQKHTEIDNQLKYHYFSIPRRWLPPGKENCVGEERTKYFFDKSFLLDFLINKTFLSWENLLGDFQFCFVNFWLAESYDSFEYWKELINLLCNCELSLHKYPTRWEQVVLVLIEQLKVVPKDFFDDILSCNNFLVPQLRSLLDVLHGTLQLENTYQTLLSTVDTLFGRTFAEFDEFDEDAPVFVEL